MDNQATTGNLARELRDLSSAIERVTMTAPCMSAALPIVQHCCDHLCLLASWYEANARSLKGAKPHTIVIDDPPQSSALSNDCEQDEGA